MINLAPLRIFAAALLLTAAGSSIAAGTLSPTDAAPQKRSGSDAGTAQSTAAATTRPSRPASTADVAKNAEREIILAPLPDALAADIMSAEVVYDIRPGETVRTAFGRWAKLAGWTLVWRSDSDLVSDASVRFPPRTEFRNAVRETMRALWARNPSITAQAYRNNVLVVSDHGDHS